MSDQTHVNNEQDIPNGFDPETWAKLTPEQRQAYTQPQPQADSQMVAQARTDAMVKDMKKKVWYTMIFSMVIGLFSRIVMGLFGNGSKD